MPKVYKVHHADAAESVRYRQELDVILRRARVLLQRPVYPEWFPNCDADVDAQ